MKKLFIALLCLLPMVLMAQHEGIAFLDYKKVTFDQVLAKAKAENKMIFVDTWTTWCGPCKSLRSETFSRKDIGDFFNERFINLDFDAEDPAWVKITEKYFITSFPTLLFLAPNGELIHIATKLQISMFDQNGMPKAGISLMNQANAVLKIYGASNDQFVAVEHWPFLKEHVQSINSIFFSRIVENKEVLKKLYGSDVEKTVSYALSSASANLFRKTSAGKVLNEEKYRLFRDLLARANPINKKSLAFYAEIKIAANKKDWKQIVQLTEISRSNGELPDGSIFSAANEFIHCDEKEILMIAAGWMDGMIKRTTNVQQLNRYFDTYITLLQNAGEMKLADQVKAEQKKKS
jgi:thiol-disulfide isomerase/thioredoxin